MALALGPAAVVSVLGAGPIVVLLTMALLWIGIHPLNFRTAGIGIEVVLEGGFLAVAVAQLGPRPGVAYWFLATALLELAQRHHVALAALNLAIATLSSSAGAAVAHQLRPDGLLSGTAADAAVAGAAVGAAYGLVEVLGSDIGARYLGHDRMAPLPWGRVFQSTVIGALLGAGSLATAHAIGLLPATLALMIPLCLLARLVRVEEARAEAERRTEQIVEALTRMASADSVVGVQETVLSAAAVLSTCGSPSLTARAQDEGPGVRYYDLGPVFGAADDAGPRQWLRIERFRFKIRTVDSDVAALETLAGAARAAGERIRERDRMHWDAHHDPLTGLLNRAGWWQEATDDGQVRDTVVLLLDLDGFKLVNDVEGHHVGDAVLQAVGAQIARLLPAGAVAARWGGDEFVVRLASAMGPDDLDELGTRLIAGVQRAAAHVTALPVTASIGTASCAPGQRADGVELVARADTAMYAAKRAGKSTLRHSSRDHVGR